jgi:hypothetical protein
MLGGEVVNYNQMFEVPLRMRLGGRAGSAMGYRSVPAADDV